MKKKYLSPQLSWLLIAAFLLSSCNLPLTFSVDTTSPTADIGEDTSDSEDTQAFVTEEPAPVEDSSEPTPTETIAPPTDTPEPTGCTNLATFVSDVSYPDDTEVEADSSFTKTWRLRNDGTCTWTSSYDLVFSHGDQMDGPAEKALAGVVSPGSTVDISSSMTAPTDPGTYQGFWKLRSNDGVLYGVGSGGSTAFWVKIVVPEEDEPLVFELLPIYEVYLLFKASGTDEHLGDNGYYDLDVGEKVVSGSADADFRYKTSIDMFTSKFEIVPLNGTRFHYFGLDAPTREGCMGLLMSAGTFGVQNRYFCYQTSDGSYGWIKINHHDSDNLLFDFATYTDP